MNEYRTQFQLHGYQQAAIDMPETEYVSHRLQRGVNSLKERWRVLRRSMYRYDIQRKGDWERQLDFWEQFAIASLIFGLDEKKIVIMMNWLVSVRDMRDSRNRSPILTSAEGIICISFAFSTFFVYAKDLDKLKWNVCRVASSKLTPAFISMFFSEHKERERQKGKLLWYSDKS